MLLGALDFLLSPSGRNFRDPALAGEVGRRLFDRAQTALEEGRLAEAGLWRRRLAELFPRDPAVELLSLLEELATGRQEPQPAVEDFLRRHPRQTDIQLLLARWIYHRISFGYGPLVRQLMEAALVGAAAERRATVLDQVLGFHRSRGDTVEMRRLLEFCREQGYEPALWRRWWQEVEEGSHVSPRQRGGRLLLAALVILATWRLFGREPAFFLFLLLPLIWLGSQSLSPWLFALLGLAGVLRFGERLLFLLAAYYQAHGSSLLAANFLDCGQRLLGPVGQVRAKILAAWLHLQDGEIARARILLRQIPARDDWEGDLQSLRASIALARGQIPAALRAATRAIQATRDARAWESLTEAYLRLGEARRVRYLLASLQTEHVGLELLQARACLQDGDADAALVLLEALRQRRPRPVPVELSRLYLLRALCRQGRERREDLRRAFICQRDNLAAVLLLFYQGLDEGDEDTGRQLVSALAARPAWARLHPFACLGAELSLAFPGCGLAELSPPGEGKDDAYTLRLALRRGLITGQEARERFVAHWLHRRACLQELARNWESPACQARLAPGEDWDALELERLILPIATGAGS